MQAKHLLNQNDVLNEFTYRMRLSHPKFTACDQDIQCSVSPTELLWCLSMYVSTRRWVKTESNFVELFVDTIHEKMPSKARFMDELYIDIANVKN